MIVPMRSFSSVKHIPLVNENDSIDLLTPPGQKHILTLNALSSWQYQKGWLSRLSSLDSVMRKEWWSVRRQSCLL